MAKKFERALLYVGPPKTGSSSIQTFALKNRDALISQGVYLPLTGSRRGNHINMVAAFAHDVKNQRKTRLNFQADIENDFEAFNRERFVSDLDIELTGAPSCKTVLFLSEAMFPATPSEIDAYRIALRPYASRLESLMYLRRQDKWLASRTMQNRKVGSRGNLDLNVGAPRRYAINIHNWHARSDRCHIRRFEPEFLVDGDLIHDFCEAIGADVDALEDADVRINESMAQEAAELVDALNPKIADMSFDRRTAYRRVLLSACERLGKGRKVGFPRAAAIEVFEQFRQINQWLHETVDPDGPDLFFHVDFDEYLEHPNNDSLYEIGELGVILSTLSPNSKAAADRGAIVEQIVSATLSAPLPPALARPCGD